jgi:hypothetical protein
MPLRLGKVIARQRQHFAEAHTWHLHRPPAPLRLRRAVQPHLAGLASADDDEVLWPENPTLLIRHGAPSTSMPSVLTCDKSHHQHVPARRGTRPDLSS